MEILIPGLMLVGFMIWASTRIKRNAARAFEREEIETAEFFLIKPEGFLAPVDPIDGTLFSAYSKDFGRDGAEHIRRATMELRQFPNVELDDMIDRTVEGASEVVSKQTGVIGGSRCANIVMERLEDGIALESHYKLIAGPASVYQLVVNVLSDHNAEFQSKVDETLGSFSLV